MIGLRWLAVRERVAAACVRAGRAPTDVTIVAVSKLHPAALIEEAALAGVTDVGENYVQELLGKQAEVRATLRWHFIGHLQRNKARQVAGKVALIHAVDSLELARELDKRAAAAGAVQAVLVAVNVAGEDTKHGVAPAAAPALVEAMAGLAHVRCDGLMTMPPASEALAARPHFAALRGLRDQLATAARPLPILSMGMSGDFEVAIAEGATHVRIGTAIFGERR